MKLQFLILLQFATMYSISGISIPNKRRDGRVMATSTTKKPLRRPSPQPQMRMADAGLGDGDVGNGNDIGRGDDMVPVPVPTVEEPMFQTMKKHMCKSVRTLSKPGAAKPNLTLNLEMTEDEVFELALTNMAHDMKSDSVLTFLPDNLRWMKQVLDQISSITMMTCTDDTVPVEYINVAKNLFMYYVHKNSVQESMLDPITGQEIKTEKPDQKMWDSIVDMLEKCKEQTTTLMFTQDCKVTEYVMAKDQSMMFIEPVEDLYDNNLGESVYGDEVIEAVWLMFSTAYARCYAINYPIESVVLNFLENFKKEFLEPLYPRWQMLSNTYNDFFPMIMGPFDLLVVKRNLRSCTAGAYMYEEIGDRQLVRPLPINIDGDTTQNFKTGRRPGEGSMISGNAGGTVGRGRQ